MVISKDGRKDGRKKASDKIILNFEGFFFIYTKYLSFFDYMLCIYFIPMYGFPFKNIAEFYLLIFYLVFLHLHLWEI